MNAPIIRLTSEVARAIRSGEPLILSEARAALQRYGEDTVAICSGRGDIHTIHTIHTIHIIQRRIGRGGVQRVEHYHVLESTHPPTRGNDGRFADGKDSPLHEQTYGRCLQAQNPHIARSNAIQGHTGAIGARAYPNYAGVPVAHHGAAHGAGYHPRVRGYAVSIIPMWYVQHRGLICCT